MDVQLCVCVQVVYNAIIATLEGMKVRAVLCSLIGQRSGDTENLALHHLLVREGMRTSPES